jgi:hypothetical protein
VVEQGGAVTALVVDSTTEKFVDGQATIDGHTVQVTTGSAAIDGESTTPLPTSWRIQFGPASTGVEEDEGTIQTRRWT